MTTHYPPPPHRKQQPSGKHSIPEMPRRYIRSLNADDIARILDGADHAEPEVVRLQRNLETPSDALFCFAVGALAALIVVAVLIYVQIGAGL